MRFNPTLVLSTSAFALSIGLASPAFAQDTAAPAEPPVCAEGQTENCTPADAAAPAAQEADTSGTIVVTGSRIRRPTEFNTIEPITVITAEEITQAGFNSATDALQSAEVTSGAGQINNFFGGFVVAGGTGANTLGLRNLGPARTLILLNGRRIAPGGTRGSVLAADLNVLPTAIVERIEILKAGASSIYGSDAVAGVVNILTDQKVRGLTLEAQVNVPEVGAGVDKRIAATFGFGSDRLNIVGSVEYRKRKALRLNDLDFTRCPIGGFLTGEGTEFGSGDGVGFDGTSCFTLDNGGVTINTLGLPTRSGLSRTTGLPGNFNRFVPAPGAGGGTPDFLGVTFYSRDTFDPASQEEEVITPVEIYTGFLAGTYDLDLLGDAELYGEVLATRRKSSALLYRQLALDYLRGSPLVPLAFRNGTFLAPTNTSSGQFIAARAFIGYGLTDSSQEVDYVRAGGGLRGDFFFPGWRYDAYAGKSWTDGTYEIESFLVDRLATSLNVVEISPGVFQCAAQASIPTCVAAPPLNADTIGGRLPAAFRDYIVDNTIGTTIFRETTFAFGVDGPLFALPGGDIQLALGAEYRKQRIDDTPDDNAINGNLFGLTAAVPTRGTDNVKELFGEVFLPILSDQPFFYRLNLNGSVRYTDYASYGSGTTYKVAGEWQPFRGFGFRGSYGTSYRAPALSEQFLGATSGFIGSGNDPCDADGFPANPANYSANQQTRAANCAAVGINVATFQQNSGITVFNRGGAETGLEAETSKNWSVGVVLQQRLSSTMSLDLALDYFDIKVENGVSSLGGATILSRCYGAADFSPTGGFCRFVTRDANQNLTVTSGFVNLSTDIVKGYEFAGRFAAEVPGGQFTLNANVTKYTEQSDRLFPEEFLLDSNGTLNTPDWVGSFDATYRTGPVTFRYGLTWLNGSSGTYDFFATSRQTGEVNEALAQDFRDSYILETDDYFLHSASVQFDIAKRYEFTVGVRNLLNKQPPRISAAVNTIGNAPLYSGLDYTGRQYFANVNFKF
ncbi:MAG: TonB-dependent receptor [Sphingomicrobium sp.]